MDFNKRLSNIDIITLCDQLNIKLNGIFMKDTIPTKLQTGYYVLNLDEQAGTGTHWTVFYKDAEGVYYFDSFGQLPPERAYNIFLKQKHAYYSDRIIQHTKSNLCGFYCVYFMLFFEINEGSCYNKLLKFHDQFGDNGLKKSNAVGTRNDNLVKRELKKYL